MRDAPRLQGMEELLSACRAPGCQAKRRAGEDTCDAHFVGEAEARIVKKSAQDWKSMAAYRQSMSSLGKKVRSSIA